MTVKTTISEEDFKNIISKYDLGDYLSFKTFANGAGQTTVLIETTQGKYVLRYYENRPEKHTLFEVNLFNYLREQNYPVPKVIKDREDKQHGIYKEKPYILIEYIEGTHSTDPNKKLVREEAEKIIEIVSKLHILTEGYNPDYFNDREIYDINYCLNKYLNRPQSLRSNEQDKWFKDEIAKLELPDALPRGLCHADLNYGNFLFKNNEVVAVLDFDMSFYWYLIYDVASLLYWWAMPEGRELNQTQMSFIAKTYNKYRNLNDLEKRHIFDILKLIILLGLSWSEEDEFTSIKKAIDKLNAIGRDDFYKVLFN